MRRLSSSASSLLGPFLAGLLVTSSFAHALPPQALQQSGESATTLKAPQHSTTGGDTRTGPRQPTPGAGPAFKPLPVFPVEKPANDWRALAEIGIALGLATVWYVLDDRNVFDWDFPSIEERFNGEAWRFDNNTFGINYLAHPLNGAGMWVLARGNRVGVWPAFAYTFLGSTFWEFAIEFQEKVSINDMIVTPGVGLAVGEFFHKLSWYLSSKKPQSVGHTALAWTLGLSVTGHRAMDHRAPPPTAQPDSLGLASEMWHQFGIHYGIGSVTPWDDTTGWLQRWGLSGELVAIPGYLTDQRMQGFFHLADFTRASLDLELSDAGLGYDFFAETLAVGYHTQTPGLASTSAISAAYLLRNTDTGGYDDRQGLFLAPGLMTELRTSHAGLSTRLRASAYPAFGSLSALSYAQWQAQRPDARTKTILGRAGYSFSQGVTGLLEAELAYGPLALSGRARAGRHWSIDGLDRSQEEVENDAPLTESVFEARAAAWLRPPGLPLEMGLFFELRRRRSQMGFAGQRVTTDVESQRTLLQLGHRF